MRQAIVPVIFIAGVVAAVVLGVVFMRLKRARRIRAIHKQAQADARRIKERETIRMGRRYNPDREEGQLYQRSIINPENHFEDERVFEDDELDSTKVKNKRRLIKKRRKQR